MLLFAGNCYIIAFMQKLSQLLKVFHQKDLTADTLRQQRVFEFLELYLPNMFPPKKVVQAWINNVKYEAYRPENVYRPEFLPFHTRDDRWLAKYAAQIIKPENANIKFADLKDFVTKSAAFDTARNQYELDLVKAQIQFLMDPEHEPNGLMKFTNLSDQREWSRQRENKDSCECFRLDVVRAMKVLGINQHTAEVGLETNADLWRRQKMENTFQSRYVGISYWHPDELNQLLAEHHMTRAELDQMGAQYRDLWLKLREYRYYGDHQAIIDELGTATENMKMSPDQACQLNVQAAQWYKRYKNFTSPLYRLDQQERAKRFGLTSNQQPDRNPEPTR